MASKPRAKRKKAPAHPGDARERILEVAGRMLRDVGPDGLRLQEIAREVGVSHPAILHHFGSRAGLVHAVVERSVRTVEADVARSLVAGDAEQDPAALIESSFRALTERGHGRLVAWLALSDTGERRVMSQLGEVAGLVHAMRVRKHEERGLPPPPQEDTTFIVTLASFALLGDAICGNLLRASMPGKHDPKGERFRHWLAERLVDMLESSRS